MTINREILDNLLDFEIFPFVVNESQKNSIQEILIKKTGREDLREEDIRIYKVNEINRQANSPEGYFVFYKKTQESIKNYETRDLSVIFHRKKLEN